MAILMHHGHPPDQIHEYAWRDVQTYLHALPTVLAIENPFIDPE